MFGLFSGGRLGAYLAYTTLLRKMFDYFCSYLRKTDCHSWIRQQRHAFRHRAVDRYWNRLPQCASDGP